MEVNNPEIVQTIIKSLEKAPVYKKVLQLCSLYDKKGGRALIVGGTIRDAILGKDPKDIDIEVFKLSPSTVRKIASHFGTPIETGRAFSVLRLPLEEGFHIDISLPRIDSKIGPGHKGFEVLAMPDMSFYDAAKRRDFTINAISFNPIEAEVLDPFNGISDLKEGILRAVDKNAFTDDPLRVLRGIQFAARFNLKPDKETFELMQRAVQFLSELPKERILEEFHKLFLKSEEPSIGLSLAMTLGVFKELFPNFNQLKSVPQEPSWHPEGNVWIHTLLATDQAEKISQKNNLTDEERLVVVLATFCHDLGKISTTKKRQGKITSYNHESVGAEKTRDFLIKIGLGTKLSRKIIKLVGDHLAPTHLYNAKQRGTVISDGAIRRLAKRIYPATIFELILVRESDCLGVDENSKKNNENCFLAGKWLRSRSEKLEVLFGPPESLINGKDLVQLGYGPSPLFSRLIATADELRDRLGFDRERIIQALKKVPETEAANTLETMLKEKR